MVLSRLFSPVLAIMLLGHLGVVFAQDNNTVQCVQVDTTTFSTTCPCGEVPFIFSVVGDTSVVDNVVNIALVLDGSGSVGEEDFLVEKEFAKNVTAAFAERNLFANGGTASYVQFSYDVDDSDTGTFYSLEDFNDFVDANDYIGSWTDIDAGIIAGRELLNAAPAASAAFMFVLTDGNDTTGDDNVAAEADEARADGITVFAIGVGSAVSNGTLLDIAGSEDRIFSVDEFNDLEALVDEILGNVGTSTISCPATNVTLSVEYGATVVSAAFPEASVSNDTVTFTVSDLEGNATEFEVMLDTCGVAEPVDPVVSVIYSDDQGNSPNFTALLDITSDVTCPPATSPPTASPTVSTTPKPTASPTPSPMAPPTLKPTVSPTPKPTVVSTPSSMVSPTPRPTVSPTPSSTVTQTPSSTITQTPSSTVIQTPNDTVQCVQVDSANFSTTCPCGEVPLLFSVVGETSVVDNVVNIALVLDGSGSVGEEDFLVEKEFAKNVTAAFADRNLFANGGTASYVQFSFDVEYSDTGTFYSLEDFNDFAGANDYIGSSTDIDAGIIAGRELLNAAPAASAAFMFVLTDGDDTVGDDNVAAEADEARADGITVFAIGVGAFVSNSTLLDIAGSEDNIFSVDEFDDLEALVDEILENVGTSTISCPATNVTLNVEYGATVVSTAFPEATISNDTVTFTVNDLEGNATEFEVMLDTCGVVEPVDPVVSITYSDDQGNSPDFTALLDITSDVTCPPATSPPTASPTVSATPKPTVSLTPSPMAPPTLKPTVFLTPKTTISPTPTPTVYSIPSSTVSQTPTSTVSPTPSSTVIQTPSSTVSQTPNDAVQCVQVDSANFSTTCPCGEVPFLFSVVGETSVVDNVVNIALVLDGSGSVGEEDFLVEKEFAKNVTAAFADRNLFANGGTASYVQFSYDVDDSDTGTFYSLEDFNDFAGANDYIGSSTDIDAGIIAGRELLNAAPAASAAFMFVLTDGDDTVGDDNVAAEADEARADGITVFAIGVGAFVSNSTLLDIAGSEDNIFSVDEFDDLEALVDEILENVGTSTISCSATNVTLNVEYGATVVSTAFPEATISNDTVTFTVNDLEGNATEFEVMLDTCGVAEPVDPVVSITYSDDQGNSPDFTALLDITSDVTCPPATSPPTASPTVSATPKPTVSLTPSPMAPPTLKPTVFLTPKTTISPTPTPTVYSIPSSTVSQTPTSTVSPTPSSTVIQTPSSTVSQTPNDAVQCVQVDSANFSTTCPCGEVPFLFSVVGETSVVDNVVNIALVLDGSGSVGEEDFLVEKEFAKNVTAAFADRNLFANGGTASYVQFSYDVDDSDTGTFYSLEDFNDFAGANDYIGSSTDIDAGIIAGRELLNAAPAASAAFMFVLTDGDDTVGDDNVAAEADEARADGITVFAIGVGAFVSNSTLLDIAGSEDNIFSVDEFDDLEALVDEILENVGTSTISCPATNVTLSVEYGATVVSTAFPEATVSNDTVTFTVNDLEGNATEFDVLLYTCGVSEPVDPVVAITYSDDQGNSPDFTVLLDVTSDVTCPPATAPSTASLTVLPTLSPMAFPTPSPTCTDQKKLRHKDGKNKKGKGHE